MVIVRVVVEGRGWGGSGRRAVGVFGGRERRFTLALGLWLEHRCTKGATIGTRPAMETELKAKSVARRFLFLLSTMSFAFSFVTLPSGFSASP